MDLKEQLKKATEDLEKLERKKEKFLADYDEKRKKILTKKKELENKIQREQEEKILRAVQDSLGKINEKNIDTFLDILKKNSEELSMEMEIALENFEENNEVVSDDLPNSGTQQSVEEQGYSYESNEP